MQFPQVLFMFVFRHNMLNYLSESKFPMTISAKVGENGLRAEMLLLEKCADNKKVYATLTLSHLS